MTPRKSSPKTPELPGIRRSEIHKNGPESPVNSQKSGYKGGRRIPYAERFRTWRELEGLSRVKIAGDLEEDASEFGVSGDWLKVRLDEFEQGRFKPPTWLVLLLMKRYGIKFQKFWHEFLDLPNPNGKTA